MNRKILLWSLVLFFGCSVLFAAIDSATSDKAVSIAIQAAVLVAIIAAIVVIGRRRS